MLKNSFSISRMQVFNLFMNVVSFSHARPTLLYEITENCSIFVGNIDRNKGSTEVNGIILAK